MFHWAATIGVVVGIATLAWEHASGWALDWLLLRNLKIWLLWLNVHLQSGYPLQIALALVLVLRLVLLYLLMTFDLIPLPDKLLLKMHSQFFIYLFSDFNGFLFTWLPTILKQFRFAFPPRIVLVIKVLET